MMFLQPCSCSHFSLNFPDVAPHPLPFTFETTTVDSLSGRTEIDDAIDWAKNTLSKVALTCFSENASE